MSQSIQMRMSCKLPRICYIGRGAAEFSVYVCNCNGIREREVRAAIEAGATKPADVFKRQQCRPQCARCVCDIREMIACAHEALRFAAE